MNQIQYKFSIVQESDLFSWHGADLIDFKFIRRYNIDPAISLCSFRQTYIGNIGNYKLRVFTCRVNETYRPDECIPAIKDSHTIYSLGSKRSRIDLYLESIPASLPISDQLNDENSKSLIFVKCYDPINRKGVEVLSFCGTLNINKNSRVQDSMKDIVALCQTRNMLTGNHSTKLFEEVRLSMCAKISRRKNNTWQDSEIDHGDIIIITESRNAESLKSYYKDIINNISDKKRKDFYLPNPYNPTTNPPSTLFTSIPSHPLISSPYSLRDNFISNTSSSSCSSGDLEPMRAMIEIERRDNKIKLLEEELAGFRGRRDEPFHVRLESLDGMRLEELESLEEKLRVGLKVVEQAMTKASSCVVCMARKSTHALYPCGHKQFCEVCVKSLSTCAVCRQSVSGAIKVYS